MDEQCKGTTRNGTRCRITRNLVNGYCSFHQNQYVSTPEVGADVAENTQSPEAVAADVVASGSLLPSGRSDVSLRAVLALAAAVLVVLLSLIGWPRRKQPRR